MTSTSFTTLDGVKLYVEEHSAINPKACIIFTHGYAEHIGRYSWMFSQLTNAGYHLIAYDQRGHGRSEGEKAYIKEFDQYVHDLHHIMQLTDKKLPLFLMAHSMGALVSAKYLIKYGAGNVKGFISSAGAYKVDPNLSPLLQKVSGFIAAIAPKLPTIKLDSSLVSSDPKEVALYDSDPLNYRGGTKANFGAQMLKAIKRLQQDCVSITIPILLMHGTSDKLIDPEGSRYMYEHIRSQDKTLHFFENAYHEIMREPEKELMMQLVINWIAKRL